MKDERKEVEGKEEKIKVLFWNIAGLRKKENDFWEYIKKFDVIGMTETWLEEDGWKKLEERMPNEFVWRCQAAVRDKKKGRAKGGIITGVRKGMQEGEESKIKETGMLERKIIIGEGKWRIITVYSGGIKETRKSIETAIKLTEEERLIIGGDFNARMGEKGKRIGMDQMSGKNRRRETKDKKEDARGRELVNMIEERGWDVLNGNTVGDEKGEYTYVGPRGETVIDYVVVNEDAWAEIEDFRVEERVESDHMPLVVEIKGEETKKEEETERKTERAVWTEIGIRNYRRRIEGMVFDAEEVNEKVKELREKIATATEKCEIKIRKGRGMGRINDWWNKECTELKREARKELRKWKKGKGTKEQYKCALGKYKSKCKERKVERRLEEEMKIKAIKNEQEAWMYINKERERRVNVCENIGMEEWREHFMQQFEGCECRRVAEWRRGVEGSGEKAMDEIRMEEVERQIRKLKKKKAAGSDRIQNEAWIYGTEGVKERLREVVNDVWRGRGFPLEWREGLICPIYKKGDKKNITNYRGITLLNTGYKVYAMCLEERLEKEMDELNVLPDGQAGFRKGRSTTDNVYILDHLVQKYIEKKSGGMYALFVDMRAAFDSVDRERLWVCLRKRGVDEHLVRRMEEIYAETRNRVRVNGKESECFWTERGLRQGCPLSPMLFAAYIGDMEEMFEKAQAGGVVVGRMKVWSLAYADDVVLLAMDEKGMKEMMGSLGRYMRRKKLFVNVEKTKMMRFRRGGGRRKEVEWRWEGEKIEEVTIFKYLGYNFSASGSDRVHVIEMVKKANKVMGMVWGIGERKFGHDYRRRVMMFDSLIKSMLMYGAEVWGWKEQEKLESVQIKYLRWVLGLDRETPGYIVLEETKRDKLRVEAGKRAIKYEENLRHRVECKILQECWREKMRDDGKGALKEREQFYRRCGYVSSEIERMREDGRQMREEIVMRDRDVQKQERRARINESRYNAAYNKIMTEELPLYLGRENGKERKLIARFRCGNEERENRYWMKEDDRICRLCGEARETVEHLSRECVELKEREENTEYLLKEDGRGVEWMKLVVNKRRKMGWEE